jgi:membrane protein implicated in regulation of membrane protease activity
MTEYFWLWGVLGLVLLGAEMATGTFYILWFGVAALVLSVLLWLLPDINIPVQLFLYTAISLGSLFIWQRYYKKSGTDLRIGQAQGEEIGRVGTIVETVSSTQNGRIQFAQGVMGSREWVAVSQETINTGSTAIIVAIEGNRLRVKSQ